MAEEPVKPSRRTRKPELDSASLFDRAPTLEQEGRPAAGAEG